MNQDATWIIACDLVLWKIRDPSRPVIVSQQIKRIPPQEEAEGIELALAIDGGSRAKFTRLIAPTGKRHDADGRPLPVRCSGSPVVASRARVMSGGNRRR
jgi:hypothetical protein